jgi:hypothetical protein
MSVLAHLEADVTLRAPCGCTFSRTSVGTPDGLRHGETRPERCATHAAAPALLEAFSSIEDGAMRHGNPDPTPVNGYYCVLISEPVFDAMRAAIAAASLAPAESRPVPAGEMPL